VRIKADDAPRPNPTSLSSAASPALPSRQPRSPARSARLPSFPALAGPALCRVIAHAVHVRRRSLSPSDGRPRCPSRAETSANRERAARPLLLASDRASFLYRLIGVRSLIVRRPSLREILLAPDATWQRRRAWSLRLRLGPALDVRRHPKPSKVDQGQEYASRCVRARRLLR
jgi:hypothetical protein